MMLSKPVSTSKIQRFLNLALVVVKVWLTFASLSCYIISHPKPYRVSFSFYTFCTRMMNHCMSAQRWLMHSLQHCWLLTLIIWGYVAGHTFLGIYNVYWNYISIVRLKRLVTGLRWTHRWLVLTVLSFFSRLFSFSSCSGGCMFRCMSLPVWVSTRT